MKIHRVASVCLTAGCLIGLLSSRGTAEEPDKSVRRQSLDDLVQLAELAREQERAEDSESARVTLKKIAVLSTDLSRPSLGHQDSNLLRNGGFEEGTEMPSSWRKGEVVPSVTLDWDRKVGRSGTSSLFIGKQENKFWPTTEWAQTVECAPDQKNLKVTVQVKAEKAAKAVVDIVFLDEDQQMISHEWACFIGMKTPKDKPASHDWKEYSGKVKIPPKTRSLQVNLQMYGPGKIWFDDVNAAYVN